MHVNLIAFKAFICSVIMTHDIIGYIVVLVNNIVTIT